MLCEWTKVREQERSKETRILEERYLLMILSEVCVRKSKLKAMETWLQEGRDLFEVKCNKRKNDKER